MVETLFLIQSSTIFVMARITFESPVRSIKPARMLPMKDFRISWLITPTLFLTRSRLRISNSLEPPAAKKKKKNQSLCFISYIKVKFLIYTSTLDFIGQSNSLHVHWWLRIKLSFLEVCTFKLHEAMLQGRTLSVARSNGCVMWPPLFINLRSPYLRSSIYKV